MTKNDLLKVIRKLPIVKGLYISLSGGEPTGKGDDCFAVIRFCGQEKTFKVIFRGDLTTTAVNLLAARLDRDERDAIFLYAPRISAACAERLRENGIRFIDDEGHVFLYQGSLYLFAAGSKHPTRGGRRQRPPSIRPFKTSTLKLLYGLMTDSALAKDPQNAMINRPFRAIGALTGLSLGSVSNAMDDLTAGGYIVEEAPGRRGLVNRRNLFDRWVQEYATRLRPKLVTAHFRPPHARWWKEADVQAWGGQWGGEVAGAMLTGYLMPETSTLYAEQVPADFIVQYDLRKDPAGSVEVLTPFWPATISNHQSTQVHPLIVYADLAASEIDRNLETAQRIYAKYLRSIIESD